MTTGPLTITDSLGVTQATDSMQEYRFALALQKHGLPFDYQWSFFDPRLITKVDFKVNTVPLWTPVFIDGEYWHGTPEARERDALVRALFRTRLRGQARDHIAIPASQLKTFEAAEDVVIKHFVRV